jgi:hypothetical protein
MDQEAANKYLAGKELFRVLEIEVYKLIWLFNII